MGKKISIILVAMLCLSMFPWTSIGVGSEAKNVKTTATLSVDAWVESKLAKPGDTISIYANTSYTDGVSVSADIMKYEHNEDVISSLSLDNLNLSGMIYTTYVSTISLTYDNAEKHWVGTYTIPSSAGGVYVADVTATDGVNTVNDNATVHLQKFYVEWLKPVQDNAETFLYGEFNDTINDIKENLIALNDTINAHGGIKGIVENLTGLPEWQALLDASYQEHDSISSPEISKVRISNPSSSSVTIFWVASSQSMGRVDYGPTQAYGETAYDNETRVNGVVTVTITGLAPETTYYYMITAVNNDGENTVTGTFKTAKEGFGQPYSAYGQILCMDGSPASSTMVYVTVGHQGVESQPLSVMTSIEGYWSVDLANLKDKNGAVYQWYNGDSIKIEAQGGTLGYGCKQGTIGLHSYYSQIFLGVSEDNITIPESKLANFLDNLTKFILSDEYENIISMVPELKSFIFGIPTEPDMIIDYLLGFNLTHYLEKIEGAEGIVAAYNALMDSDKYADFQNALNTLQESETYWNQENLSIAIMNLFISDEMMNMLNATVSYLQGNDTALQNLINSFVALDGNFNSQLESLMKLPEFQNLMGAVMNNTNLSPVFESINTTFNNIKNRVETMMNSTQLQDLKTAIENVQRYAGSNVLYESEWFSEDETFNYNYTVKDWVKELYLDLDPSFDGYYDYENDTYVPGTGNITVTLTDPEGFVHTYTESYNGSGYYYNYYDGIYIEEKYKPGYAGYETHDYTILFPTPGNWTVNVATFSDSGDGGNYRLQIGPKDDFTTYMLKESFEELFFVFNAGIAIETDYFQTIGTDGSAKLVAYDANGRIANEEINVIVSRNTGGMAGASSIIPATILYVWVSGFMMPSAGMEQVTPVISCTQSAGYDNSAMITIISITPQQSINPDDVIWSLGGNGSSVGGVLSTSDITVDDVTVTWYDNDGNYLLSAGDTINIHKSGKPLAGYHFKLSYLPTDSAMLEMSLVGRSAKDTYYDEEYVEAEAGSVSSPFEALPYIKQMMEEINAGIVYEGKVTTDSNGEVTISFPVEEFGIYTIDAYFEDENKIGFGESVFIGESYVPEIGLTQIGKFAGIPVYMNPNKIGENITFNVNVPAGENATVGIAPMPLNELFPDINISYEPSDTTITGPDSVSLQVNGPISLIAVVTGMPVGEAEYGEYNESYTSYPDTSFSIPQFNISFGILLTSNVSVTLDVPNILKGERSQIDVTTTGTPVITYGFAYYANGLDIMSLDVTTLSKIVYESAVYQKEYNLTDVMESMKSMICGPGNTAFVTIPKLAVDGEYSFITFTNVDNTDIGAAVTSVNVYAEVKEIPAVISNETVDNKEVVVTYVGSGKVTIKKVTVTPSAPANVKHIGIFIEIDTTGTVHNAFITIRYNDSDVVDIDESQLRMYYLNETTNEWALIPDSGVWTNNKTVWARIDHFTIFAPMAEKSAAGPAPISWLIYVGVISAVIIILVISLAATVKRKKKALPPST